MAGAREIRTKIKSVQNTRKVTRALEMVSASKIRKAQDLMKASRPYARLMRQLVDEHRDNPEVLSLYAEAEMVATRSDWWDRRTGQPAGIGHGQAGDMPA